MELKYAKSSKYYDNITISGTYFNTEISLFLFATKFYICAEKNFWTVSNFFKWSMKLKVTFISSIKQSKFVKTAIARITLNYKRV